MRQIVGCGLLVLLAITKSLAQVDTTYIYNNSTPYGSLDIRIARSASEYYYLQEGKTFSFRVSAPGVKTGTYLDMTNWDSSPYLQGNLREKVSSADYFVMNYRFLLPQNYNQSKSYPLIVVFHGLGETANCWETVCHHADKNYDPVVNNPPAPTRSDFPLLNNDHQLANGGHVHLQARNDAQGKLPDDSTLPARAFPGFVLFPQNLNGWNVATVQDAIRLIRLLTKKYNIDKNRIYIHGLSNGGYGVYEAIKRAPWMFASAATMSAISDGFITNHKMTSAVSHIPMWAFQGGQDIRPTPQKTENYIKQFRDAGAVVRYTLYPEVGHGTWNLAYQEPDFFSWMLGRNKANIHVFAGTPTICESAGLKLELAPGFRAYQWEFNGQIVSGATASFYMAKTPGKYRARFSRVLNPTESQWNRWSDAIEVKAGQGLPQAVMKQHGTVLLRDLNNFADARLESVGDFAHYYWYKNGQIIDFPGDQDDTLKYVTIKPAAGNGVYTLVTSNFENCRSAPSDGKTIFFENSAPSNITAATNFKASPKSAAEITLTWTDASTNEDGFEIWRRRKLSATSFTPWEMATLTPANASTFTDAGLMPSSTYQYKMRAVSNTGRSSYTPTVDNQFLEATTPADKQAPDAPKDLVVKPIGVNAVKLSWRASKDNTGIDHYAIYYATDSVHTNSPDTTYVLKDLKVNSKYTFRVRAIDWAGNRSVQSNLYSVSTYMSGLYYEHSTGATLTLDSINWSNPEFTGMVTTFTLAPKTQHDYYNFRFDGYLLITAPGSYQFRTTSDDGSRLRINNAVAVDNNGVHTMKTVTSAAITLSKGPHRISADFFEYNQSDSLIVEYSGPDTNNSWSKMSIAVLKSSETVITDIETDIGPADNFIVDVYPNPSVQNNINVKIRSVVNSPVHVQLLDPLGKQILNTTVEPQAAAEGVKLTYDGVLIPGFYFIKAQQERAVVIRKLIVR